MHATVIAWQTYSKCSSCSKALRDIHTERPRQPGIHTEADGQTDTHTEITTHTYRGRYIDYRVNMHIADDLQTYKQTDTNTHTIRHISLKRMRQVLRQIMPRQKVTYNNRNHRQRQHQVDIQRTTQEDRRGHAEAHGTTCIQKYISTTRPRYSKESTHNVM